MAGHEPFRSSQDFNFISKLDARYQIEAAAQEITTHESEHVLHLPIISYDLELHQNGEFGMYGKTMQEMIDVSEPGGRESLESLQVIAKAFSEDPAIKVASFHSRDIGYGRDYVYIFEHDGKGKIKALAVEYNGDEAQRVYLRTLLGNKGSVRLHEKTQLDDLYSPMFLRNTINIQDFPHFVAESYKNTDGSDGKYGEYQKRLQQLLRHEDDFVEEQVMRVKKRMADMKGKIRASKGQQEILETIQREVETYERETGKQLVSHYKTKNSELARFVEVDAFGFWQNNVKNVDEVKNDEVQRESEGRVSVINTAFTKIKDLLRVKNNQEFLLQINDQADNPDRVNATHYNWLDSLSKSHGLEHNLLARLQERYGSKELRSKVVVYLLKMNPGSVNLIKPVAIKERNSFEILKSRVMRSKEGNVTVGDKNVKDVVDQLVFLLQQDNEFFLGGSKSVEDVLYIAQFKEYVKFLSVGNEHENEEWQEFLASIDPVKGEYGELFKRGVLGEVLEMALPWFVALEKNNSSRYLYSGLYYEYSKVLLALITELIRKNEDFKQSELIETQSFIQNFEKSVNSKAFATVEIKLLWMVKLFVFLQRNHALRLHDGEDMKKMLNNDVYEKQRLGLMMSIVLYLARLRELGKSNHPIIPAVFGAKKKLKQKKQKSRTIVVYQNSGNECGIITP